MHRGDAGLGVNQQLKNRYNILSEKEFLKIYVSEFRFYLSYLLMADSHYLSYHDFNMKQ